MDKGKVRSVPRLTKKDEWLQSRQLTVLSRSAIVVYSNVPVVFCVVALLFWKFCWYRSFFIGLSQISSLFSVDKTETNWSMVEGAKSFFLTYAACETICTISKQEINTNTTYSVSKRM